MTVTLWTDALSEDRSLALLESLDKQEQHKSIQQNNKLEKSLDFVPTVSSCEISIAKKKRYNTRKKVEEAFKGLRTARFNKGCEERRP